MPNKIDFHIPELPPSLNKIYRTGKGRMYKTADVHDFERTASYFLPHLKEPISEPCRLVLFFYFKDSRKYKVSDISNLAKVTEDTLVLCGLLENDNLITEINYFKKKGSEDKIEGYFTVGELNLDKIFAE